MFVFAFVKCLVDRYEIKKKKNFFEGLGDAETVPSQCWSWSRGENRNMGLEKKEKLGWHSEPESHR